MANQNEQPKGLSVADFEAQRRGLAISLLQKSNDFVAWDLEFNRHVSELMGLIVARARENPALLDPNSRLPDDLADAIVGKMGKGVDPSKGDIAGGGWADDLFSVIKDILTGEKEFIQSIISKILGL